MSVFVMKKMGCIGEKMENVVGDLVKTRTIYRYNPRNDEVEAKNLLSLAISDLDSRVENMKKEAEKEGYTNRAGETRPYDKRVLDTLFVEPVFYTSNEQRDLCWGGNYKCNEFLDFALSKKFPDKVFEVVEIIETDVIDKYQICNGVITHS